MIDLEYKQKLQNYIEEQVSRGGLRAKAYTVDANGKQLPHRNAYVKLHMHLINFVKKRRRDVRWIIFSGLRGAGKTTLLSQLYLQLDSYDVYKLFISLDDVTKVLSSNLVDIITAFEELVGKPLEGLDKPLVLFLDEVQYDSNWAITLKTVYDRNPNILIFTTGSSALALNYNPDIARRALFEKLFPMSFTEYMKIKHGKYETKGVSSNLRDAIFYSKNAQEAYKRLCDLDNTVKRYWYGVSKFELGKYLEYGSLPYMINFENQSLIYDQISQTIDKILVRDIPQAGTLANDIVAKIPHLLYIISGSDTLNISKLSKIIDISRPTLTNLLDLLEKTELLYRVYPYGSHFSQVKKPSKYLFTSPSFRAMYFHFIGNTIKENNYKGHLIEDIFATYCRRIFWKKTNFSLTYDSARGGADFVLGLNNKNVVCELGYGNKDYRQLFSTMQNIEALYGICISSRGLELREDINTISLPLQTFLLA